MAQDIELVPTEEALLVMVTDDEGTVHTHEMTWEQFERLRTALQRD